MQLHENVLMEWTSDCSKMEPILAETWTQISNENSFQAQTVCCGLSLKAFKVQLHFAIEKYRIHAVDVAFAGEERKAVFIELANMHASRQYGAHKLK